MAARLRRARVRIVASAGHAPHLESPRELAALVTDWFKNREESSEGDRT
jgi:pimeloyl-ACP methyl ester carboxylesterase